MMLVNKTKGFFNLLSRGEFHEIQRKLGETRKQVRSFSGKSKKKNEWSKKIDALRASNSQGERQWWQDLFLPKTYHLQDVGDANLKQIYSPLYDSAYVDDRLHEQFREGAEHHSAYYYFPDWYHYLIERMLKETGFDMDPARKFRILDIGSGAGNTILPLISIFPKAEILATELSVEMMVQMRKRLEKCNWEGRCSMLQLDAENLNFKPDSFDLIVGGAILHHLFQPEKTLNGVARVLKPGGTAIFFEPFAPGNMILAVILQVILSKNFTATEKLPEKMESYLNSYINGCDTVWGIDKSDSKYLRIDDKWFFPKHYFTKLATEAGFTDCKLISLHNEDTPFRSQLRQVVVVYGGVPEESIPTWAWETVDEYDKNLSIGQKRELIIEACAVLTKTHSH